MKKIIVLLLSVLMILSLSACSSGKVDDTTNNNEDPVVVDEERFSVTVIKIYDVGHDYVFVGDSKVEYFSKNEQYDVTSRMPKEEDGYELKQINGEVTGTITKDIIITAIYTFVDYSEEDPFIGDWDVEGKEIKYHFDKYGNGSHGYVRGSWEDFEYRLNQENNTIYIIDLNCMYKFAVDINYTVREYKYTVNDDGSITLNGEDSLVLYRNQFRKIWPDKYDALCIDGDWIGDDGKQYHFKKSENIDFSLMIEDKNDMREGLLGFDQGMLLVQFSKENGQPIEKYIVEVIDDNNIKLTTENGKVISLSK